MATYHTSWPVCHCHHIYLVGQSHKIMVPYLSYWPAHYYHFDQLIIVTIFIWWVNLAKSLSHIYPVGQLIIVTIPIWLANLTKSLSHIYLVGQLIIATISIWLASTLLSPYESCWSVHHCSHISPVGQLIENHAHANLVWQSTIIPTQSGCPSLSLSPYIYMCLPTPGASSFQGTTLKDYKNGFK